MKMLDRIFAPIVVGILIAMIGTAGTSAPTARHVIGGPVAAKNGGRWGVSGRFQPNGGITGSAKLNLGISGSNIRPKH
jgi:hypothetical protein